jgi:hypothetical protein
MVVQVLHPRAENPCAARNPAELLLMGANPSRSAKKRTNPSPSAVYDSLTVEEKLALGRLGIGKRQIQTRGDLEKARAMVDDARRLRNRLPNPAVELSEAGAEAAMDLAGDFHERINEQYFVAAEPHVPAGDYAELGDFIGLGVKPTSGGQVLEISFERNAIKLVSDSAGRQLYIVGDGQEISEEDLGRFGADQAEPTLLGEGRTIAYRTAKWHAEVPDTYRGKCQVYEHEFGEEGGRRPSVLYSRRMRRLMIDGGDYTVEGVGIRN